MGFPTSFRLIVRFGSNATETFSDDADQCLLFPASDQTADKSQMTQKRTSH